MIQNLAKQEHEFAVFHDVGVVTRVDHKDYTICVDSTHYTARKAASCLLIPEVGDKVELLMDKHNCYVLTVLEKNEKNERSNKFVFEGDAEFVCETGRMSMVSREGLHFFSSGSLNLTSSDMQIAAEKGSVNINQLTVLGSYLLAKMAKIKVIGSSLDSFFERFRQKTKCSYREVEETDYVKAKQLDYNADRLITLHGKYSFISAEEDVKINGERIHMG